VETSTLLVIGAVGIGGLVWWQSKKTSAAPPAAPSPGAPPGTITPPGDLLDRMLNAYRAWQKANPNTGGAVGVQPIPRNLPPLSPSRAQWITIMQSAVDPRVSPEAWGYLYDQSIGFLIGKSALVDEATIEKWFVDAVRFYP